jgi:hypothetical protein
MSDRERKRVERQKRKRRSAQRVPDSGGAGPQPGALPAKPGQQSPDGDPRRPNREPAPSRSEIKDADARAALEPLQEGERPGAVTAGALISVAVALLSVIGYALWDVVQDKPRPPLVGVVVFVAVFGVMAWGMWHARYWAVLGFQTVLVLVLVLTALGIVAATTILQVVGDLVLLAGSGGLFYLMIRAMARIQMPERVPRE